VSTQHTTEQSLLHCGVSLYQIFSNEKFIFKMTHTCETLIQYEYYNDGSSNIVKKTVTFKKVPCNDPRISELGKANYLQKQGHTKPFINGIRYNIYALYRSKNYLNGKFRYTGFMGYKLIPSQDSKIRPLDSVQPSGDLYFVL